MRNILIGTTLAILLARGLTAVAAEAQPTVQGFAVRCDLGSHEAAGDRLASEKELRLLRDAIEDAYPRLPADLQEIARKIVFVVSHREQKWTKLVMGWGPEDDADYRYPDTGFYPEGTIKVTFSEKTIEALALGERLSRTGPDVAEGAHVFARYIIAHQLKHAQQYHNAPVSDQLALHRALDRSPVCREGLLDEELAAQEEIRLKYEKEAYRTHRTLIEKDFLLAYASAVESWEKRHPAQFAEGGPYHLLASSASNAFPAKLREEALMADKGGEFGPIAKFPNEGQFVPVQIVWKLKKLNDGIAASTNPLVEARRAGLQVEQLRAEWSLFMSGEPARSVRGVLPCKPEEVENRYRTELERYEALVQPSH